MNYLKNIPLIETLKKVNQKDFLKNTDLFKKVFNNKFDFNFLGISKIILKDGEFLFQWFDWKILSATFNINQTLPDLPKLKLELNFIKTYALKKWKKSKTFLKVTKRESPDFEVLVNGKVEFIECTRWGETTYLTLNEAYASNQTNKQLKKLSDNPTIKLVEEGDHVFIKEFSVDQHIEYEKYIQKLINLINKKIELKYFNKNIKLFISIELEAMDQKDIWEYLTYDRVQLSNQKYRNKYISIMDYILDKTIKNNTNIELIFFYTVLNPQANSTLRIQELLFCEWSNKANYLKRKGPNSYLVEQRYKIRAAKKNIK